MFGVKMNIKWEQGVLEVAFTGLFAYNRRMFLNNGGFEYGKQAVRY